MAGTDEKVTIADAWERTQFATEQYAALTETRITAYNALSDADKLSQSGLDANDDLQTMGQVLRELEEINRRFKSAWERAAHVELSAGLDAAIAALKVR